MRLGLGCVSGCKQRGGDCANSWQVQGCCSRSEVLAPRQHKARLGAQQRAPHLEEVRHQFPTSIAQVEFPGGINLLEQEPSLDISYNFLRIEFKTCNSIRSSNKELLKKHIAGQAATWVHSGSSFSIFIFRSFQVLSNFFRDCGVWRRGFGLHFTLHRASLLCRRGRACRRKAP